MFLGRHRKVRKFRAERPPLLSILGRLKETGPTLRWECGGEFPPYCGGAMGCKGTGHKRPVMSDEISAAVRQ